MSPIAWNNLNGPQGLKADAAVTNKVSSVSMRILQPWAPAQAPFDTGKRGAAGLEHYPMSRGRPMSTGTDHFALSFLIFDVDLLVYSSRAVTLERSWVPPRSVSHSGGTRCGTIRPTLNGSTETVSSAFVAFGNEADKVDVI